MAERVISSHSSALVPSVGRVVHYVSYGTPGGEYPSVCRAAIITDAATTTGPGQPVAPISLCVLNPTGLFFNQAVGQDEDGKAGGTWHWPERV